MAVEPRHDECRTCVFFNARRLSAKCLRCGAGEFYEERVEEQALPDEDELRELFSKVRTDDGTE